MVFFLLNYPCFFLCFVFFGRGQRESRGNRRRRREVSGCCAAFVCQRDNDRMCPDSHPPPCIYLGSLLQSKQHCIPLYCGLQCIGVCFVLQVLLSPGGTTCTDSLLGWDTGQWKELKELRQCITTTTHTRTQKKIHTHTHSW